MAPTSFQTYNAPPPGFDLRSASAAELRRYGLPRRPDPDTEPELHAHWQHAVARVRTIVRAELGRNPALDRFSAARHRRYTAGDGTEVKFGASGWAGAIVELADINVSPPATTVSARWQVPWIDTTSQPEDPLGPMVLAVWAGIGNANDGGGILQAGTAAQVNEQNVVNYYAWGEWYPAGDPAPIGNFPVTAGDVVAFTVCNTTRLSGTLHGAAYMLNETTGVATAIGIDPPGSITSAPGTNVEWVVEAPDYVDDLYLPDFGGAMLLDCAGGTEQQSFGVAGASTTEIDGSFGDPLTQSVIIGSDDVAVVWLGSS
ncbi:MAG: G1 family glutamic endopeptidase [Streptosporangiaceae bacterium]